MHWYDYRLFVRTRGRETATVQLWKVSYVEPQLITSLTTELHASDMSDALFAFLDYIC